MKKVVHPSFLLFAAICLAATLLAGCGERKEQPPATESAPVAPAPQTTPAPQPDVSLPAPSSKLPPGHPTVAPSKLPPGHPATAPQQDIKTLPKVTLGELNVQESEDGAVTRITITAGGNFGSNVIRKENPDRIIMIIHNAVAGDLVGTLQVNNGTVGRIEVAQLESGQGPAVRVTIGLAGKNEYQVVPGDKSLNVEISKRVKG